MAPPELYKTGNNFWKNKEEGSCRQISRVYTSNSDSNFIEVKLIIPGELTLYVRTWQKQVGLSRASRICARSEIRCGEVKVEKIASTYVRNLDTDKCKVWLEGGEQAYRYKNHSMILLLKKAMTRKATFIIQNNVVCWIELHDGALRRASEHRKKPRNLLLETVDKTLEQVFTKDCARTVQGFIENNLHLTRQEIVEKPDVFSYGLRRLLGSGATVIEVLIAKNLYHKVGLKFEEKKGYEFPDYINELKKKLG